MNERQAANLPSHMLMAEGGVTLVDHQAESGKRQVIPGIERALPGMKTGRDCKIRIFLDLEYGHKRLPSLILPHALLVVAHTSGRPPHRVFHPFESRKVQREIVAFGGIEA